MNRHDWLCYTVLLFSVSGPSWIFSYIPEISGSSNLPVHKQQAHTERYLLFCPFNSYKALLRGFFNYEPGKKHNNYPVSIIRRKKKLKFIMATTSSFTSRYRNRLRNKAAQDAIITRKVENYTAFARQHIYKWVNKRSRLLARVHKAVNSTVVLSAVASPNEDRLIALEAQIKLFKHIMRSNGESSRQSDCKICLKILYFCTPFPLHIPMLIKKGSIWPVFAPLF